MLHPRAIALAALLLTCALSLQAHPVPNRHVDRTVVITVQRAGLDVEYTLALNELTMLEHVKELQRSGQKSTDIFRENYQKHIQQGLLIVPAVALQPVSSHLREEVDHLRFTFHFRLQFERALEPGQELAFRLQDSALQGTPGHHRMVIRPGAGIELLRANAAETVEKAVIRKLHEIPEDEHAALLVAKADFRWSTDESNPESVPKVERPEREEHWSLRTWLESDAGFFTLLGLAFLFGAAHALTPGHGKTLVAAYLIGSRGTVGHACLLGLVTTLTHTSMVFFLALVVPILAGNDGRLGPLLHFALSMTCGVIVVMMAFTMLLNRLAGRADHVHLIGGHGHGHGGDDDEHGHGHGHSHGLDDAEVTWWSLITLGITGGLVPCVDALALLTLTWVKNMLWLGFWLTLFFSLGLATVLVVLGIMVVKLRGFATSRTGAGGFVRALPIFSALATLLLGFWMCYEAFQQRPW
jgi:ABC-type nickel/cobalt efflux system permease component RcnA